MTCVVGFVNDNKVIIGADSGAVGGNIITKRTDEKVFKVGDFVVGCSGSFRMMQILRFGLSPPPIGEKEIFEYLCTDFATAVRKAFSENGFEKKDSDGAYSGPYFLIGYKNRLFAMEDDYQIAEHLDGIYCIGSGEEFAYGALLTIKDSDIKAEDKVLKALEVSAYFCKGVTEPFVIKTTEEKE